MSEIMSEIAIKADYRARARQMLDQLDSEYAKTAAENITDALLGMPEIINSRNIFVYIPFSNEIAIQNLVVELEKKGKSISVPKINGGEMFAVKYSNDLKPNKYGVLEPESNYYISNIDVAVIPGLLFDENLGRLGRGKGFYDRFLLGKKFFKIGVGYDFQLIDHIPTEIFDIKMDKIVTDKRVI